MKSHEVGMGMASNLCSFNVGKFYKPNYHYQYGLTIHGSNPGSIVNKSDFS